jgi:hypothetical protein
MLRPARFGATFAAGPAGAAHLFGPRSERVALYIPDALEEHVRRALDRGRRLQALLYEAAQRYARAEAGAWARALKPLAMGLWRRWTPRFRAPSTT